MFRCQNRAICRVVNCRLFASASRVAVPYRNKNPRSICLNGPFGPRLNPRFFHTLLVRTIPVPGWRMQFLHFASPCNARNCTSVIFSVRLFRLQLATQLISLRQHRVCFGRLFHNHASCPTYPTEVIPVFHHAFHTWPCLHSILHLIDITAFSPTWASSHVNAHGLTRSGD